MADIQKVSGPPFFRVRIPGIRLTGWAVQYISGLDDPEIKPGYWLSQWNVSGDRMSVTFAFEPEVVMSYGDESEAKKISDALRGHANVETKVAKIGWYLMVIAGREGSWGSYIGFELDNEILECSERECTQEYRLRYTKDEERNLEKHRLAARREIEFQHPKHKDQIQIA
jgi:hypothetical protein